MTAVTRKLSPFDVRQLRRNLAKRQTAVRMIAEAREILRTVPTPTQSARRLGIHHTRAVMAARGHAYKEVQ